MDFQNPSVSTAWKIVPHTRMERRHVLNVREGSHTCMVWDKRYYDSDTGKFNSDKMHTIYSRSISDLYDSGDYSGCNYYPKHKFAVDERQWFKPKDNDFDAECEREEEEKRRQYAIEHSKQLAIQEEAKKELQKQQRVEWLKENVRRKELEYQKLLADAEARCRANMQRASGHYENKVLSNVMPNKWIPK